MNHSMKNRLVAMLLAVCTILGMGVPASASSVQDGSKTCTISPETRHTFLVTDQGTYLGGSGYTYTTNDGLTGPAYCIDHGLYYTGKVLPITGKYTVSPQTAGAFANGYPQHSLETFLGLYLSNHPILSGLTEDEYRYATQIAVWATLGQLAVEGTAFTNGRERISQPSGDAQQMRVFCAVQCILGVAKDWDKHRFFGLKYACSLKAPFINAFQGIPDLKKEVFHGQGEKALFPIRLTRGTADGC